MRPDNHSLHLLLDNLGEMFREARRLGGDMILPPEIVALFVPALEEGLETAHRLVLDVAKNQSASAPRVREGSGGELIDLAPIFAREQQNPRSTHGPAGMLMQFPEPAQIVDAPDPIADELLMLCQQLFDAENRGFRTPSQRRSHYDRLTRHLTIIQARIAAEELN